jgi:hypothetical protein
MPPKLATPFSLLLVITSLGALRSFALPPATLPADGAATLPATQPAKIGSEVLNGELTSVIRDAIAWQKKGQAAGVPIADPDTARDEIQHIAPHGLLVSPEQEAEFRAGRFDDAMNRPSVNEARQIFQDFKMDLPLVLRYLYAVDREHPLKGVRLQLCRELSDMALDILKKAIATPARSAHDASTEPAEPRR